jgi:site-specific DNA-methyltransferase (adenine-specific)
MEGNLMTKPASVEVIGKKDPEYWCDRVRKKLGESAQNVIDAGRLLIEAKEKVGHGNFERMFADHDQPVAEPLPFGVRTAQRLIAIADDGCWLSKATHASLLPSSWMTLYELSRLPGELAAAAIEDGRINPAMERREARDLLGDDRKAKRKAAEAETLEKIERSGGLTFQIRGGDFQSSLGNLEHGSVDLVLTDPPYGEAATQLYGRLAEWAADKLKPGGSLVAYCGQATLGEVIAAMSPHLKYWWCLALTHSAMPQQLPGKWVQVRWKPIVWFVNQRRCTKHYIDDVIVGTPPRKDLHEWAQGVGEVKPIIESLTEAGELVVDPFAGSGSFGRAANDCGRHFIGSDNGSHKDGKR